MILLDYSYSNAILFNPYGTETILNAKYIRVSDPEGPEKNEI